MSDGPDGVGVNGETDDFAARYDKLVVGAAAGWVVKTVVVGVIALAVVGLVARAILG